jgi:hypothetical protein
MIYKMTVKKPRGVDANKNKKKGRSSREFLTLGFHNNVPDPNQGLEGGLDYILGHFPQEESIWPRTISTRTTDKRQVLVYNKEEVVARFAQANWLDCRISAYPSYTEYKGINRQAPRFIFIDLDRSTFDTEKAHNKALTTTLENIRQKLGGHPTVLWSGNGYHIYQPVETPILEQEEIFSKFLHMKPSRKLMQFAESSLSANKADRAHNMTVSFKNCMLRVPGSVNSKNGQFVKLLDMWDGHRPKINPLLEDFYIYLSALRIKEITRKTDTKTESYYQSISRYLKLQR